MAESDKFLTYPENKMTFQKQHSGFSKAEEAERKAHASVHPAAAAITLRKGLGALRWSECLEFSECGGGGGGVLEQE